jgi:serine/threonine-protein kinase
VLFEALTGAMRYAIDGSLAARLHAIESTDAQRPSAFRRELVGDIDAILLTALAKRPADRYATAADFAADSRASLAGEPIRARRESMTRITRFAAADSSGSTSSTRWSIAACCVTTAAPCGRI